METRYHALRTIGSIFRVVGYIVLVFTILAALAVCGISVISGTALESASSQLGLNTSGTGFLGGLFGGLIAGFLVILYGGMIALGLVASGELIYLLIGVEENTRRTAVIVENQNRLPPSQPAATQPVQPAPPPVETLPPTT